MQDEDPDSESVHAIHNNRKAGQESVASSCASFDVPKDLCSTPESAESVQKVRAAFGMTVAFAMDRSSECL